MVSISKMATMKLLSPQDLSTPAAADSASLGLEPLLVLLLRVNPDETQGAESSMALVHELPGGREGG